MKTPPPEQKAMAGRYRLEERVGSGGMGVVWRAFDEVLNRWVAIKVLPEPLQRDPEALERFRREALTAASLSHPQMANIFDFVDDGGPPAIVMEFVEGETVAERLATKGRFAPKEARRIAIGVLSALEAAHRAGIVHRDVKPGNILLARDGAVKVADFGIARAMTDATLTQEGTVLSTPHYMSPEQLRGKPATAASDQFAVGVVLYEMLTGARPFTGETPASVAMARLTQDPAPPSRHVPSLPRALDDVVMRALAREPEDRFPDATAMRRALQGRTADATHEMPVLPTGHDDETVRLAGSPAPRVLPPPPSTGKLRLRRLTGAVVLPLLAVVVLAVFLFGAIAGGRTTEVPNFEGKTLSQARAIASTYDLVIGDTRHRSSSRPRNVVLAQSARAGTEVADGTRITLTLSRGCCTVPSLVGLKLEEARDLARDANVTLEVQYRPAKDDEGRVLSQEPGAERVVDPGDRVTIFVATKERDEKRGKDRDDE